MFYEFKNVEGDDTSTELRIAGEIVSNDDAWLYEYFGLEATSPNAFKAELEKYKGKNITVWIDSIGGDVFAAAGIYNALKEHNGQVNVKIDVKAISAASVIAMAGDKVEMSPVAIMMIHNPLTVAQGDSREMVKVAGILDQVKETIVNAYELKTGRSRAKISQMMNDETWMSAKVAQREGFVDGMLYTDPAAVTNSFEFNRMQVNNTITPAMMEFFKKNVKGDFGQPSTDKPDSETQAILVDQRKRFQQIKTKIQGGN